VDLSQILQLAFIGLTLGSIYAMVALGFTIVYNATGVANLAQGEFVMLGGLLAVAMWRQEWPLLVAAVGAVIAIGLLGGGLYVMTIDRVREGGILRFIFITLGISIVLRSGAQLVWGSEAQRMPGFVRAGPFEVMGATITAQALTVLVISAALMVALYLFFKRTRFGQATLAVSENREGAALVGIYVRRASLAAFALGALLGALGGVLITPITTALYSMGVLFTLKGFAASVLGGFGNVPGAVLGGLLLGLFEAGATTFFPAGFRDLVALGILVVILILRPGGLLGSRALT
jgi:branched-chain amino acid transport system permease protein